MSISIVTQDGIPSIWISLFVTEELSQVSDIAMTAALDSFAMILSSDIFGRIDIELLLPKTKPIVIGTIYRPPKMFDFIDKFENVLCQLKSDTETIILGFSGLLHKIRSIIEEQFSVTLVGSFIICSKPNNCIILVNDIPSELLLFFIHILKSPRIIVSVSDFN
jgi:hypothetical protein